MRSSHRTLHEQKIIMHEQYPLLNKQKQVVAIGGGHGLGRVMAALSFLKKRLAGIVTTTDNGSSTGRIRAQQGGIAWGDIRNCLVQLKPRSTTASELFEYRFTGHGELEGHNLGNLIFRALEDLKVSPVEAINLTRSFLKIDANIIPMSEHPVHLAGKSIRGESVFGEVAIDELQELPQSLHLIPPVPATTEALRVLTQADLIILGPGSFFTSIIPPLLLPEIATILRETQATVIFVDNLGIEHSAAAQLSLCQRVEWIENTIGKSIIDIVITQPETSISCLSKRMIKTPLKDSQIEYRHDLNLLRSALEMALQPKNQL